MAVSQHKCTYPDTTDLRMGLEHEGSVCLVSAVPFSTTLVRLVTYKIVVSALLARPKSEQQFSFGSCMITLP